MRRPRNFIGPAGMGGMVSLWGQSSLIRSVQYGTITFTNLTGTATINAVNTANSVVCYLGFSTTDTTTSLGRNNNDVRLTNSTTVTGSGDDNVALKTVSFCVLEYAPGVVKSIQTGVISITGGSSNTATITAVNVNKTSLVWGNQNTNGPTNDGCYSRSTLTNATTITQNASAANYTDTPFTALEFF